MSSLSSAKITLSVITPMHNEIDIVDEFVERCIRTLKQTHANCSELIVIDDQSDDGTWQRLQDLAQQHAPLLRVEQLSQRSGQVGGQKRGIELARGKNLIFMDGDLQIPPEQVPAVAGLLELNYNVVATFHSHLKTRKRIFEPRVLLYAPANHFGNLLLRKLLGTEVRSASSDFLGIQAEFLKGANLGFNDQRYLIPIARRRGADKITELRVEKCKRSTGRSKYSVVKKMFTGIAEIFIVWQRVQSGYYDREPITARSNSSDQQSNRAEFT